MKEIHISLKELPQSLQSALDSAGYRRQDIKVFAAENFQPSNGSATFKGNRGYVMTVNMQSGERKILMGNWGGSSGFTKTLVDDCHEDVPIPENAAIILGESGGRGNFAHILVRPESLAKMLPEGSDTELSEEQMKALAIFKGIRAGYRRQYFDRAELGEYKASAPLLQGLIAKSLIKANRAGSMRITTAGKNAVGNYPVPY